MAARDLGCFSVLLFLPSAIVHVFRQTAWERSFPRPQKLHAAKEAMDVVAALDSEHGGTVAAFPYVQRAWELDPQNVQAAKFMAGYYTRQKKFAEALPYLRVAVRGAHPDSIYIVMLEQTLAALGRQAEAQDENARGEER